MIRPCRRSHDSTTKRQAGAEVVAGPFGHTLDMLPVLSENFTKNPFPCCWKEQPQPMIRAGSIHYELSENVKATSNGGMGGIMAS